MTSSNAAVAEPSGRSASPGAAAAAAAVVAAAAPPPPTATMDIDSSKLDATNPSEPFTTTDNAEIAVDSAVDGYPIMKIEAGTDGEPRLDATDAIAAFELPQAEHAQNQIQNEDPNHLADLDAALAYGNEHFPQHPYMPSPPTVSSLSTPAATGMHSISGENALDDDLPKLSDENLTAAAASASNQNSAPHPNPPDLGSTAGLEEPFLPDETQLRLQSQGYAAVATTDDDIAYGPHPANMGRISRQPSMGSIDPNAFMISLAQASSAQLAGDYPTAVAPSEISLQASLGQESEAVTGAIEPVAAGPSQKLESFARIEFADSVFQMTTYAVIIGRDQRAMEQARKDERREERYRQLVEENERQGLPPPTPLGRDKGKFSKSYVSEEGGMLGPESDGEDSSTRPLRRRRAPSSAGAPSQQGDAEDEQGEPVKSNRQYVSHTEGAAAVDLGTLQPSHSHVPFVGIHSPGPNIASRTRGISRQHLKIQFNERKGVFEGISLHRNGFFCDDIHYGLDEPVTIRSGDRLQIKDVEFSFVINGVDKGKTGAEEYHDVDEASSKRCSVGGKEMSFDFEHSDHEKFHDTSEDLSDIENMATPSPAPEDIEMEDQEDIDESLQPLIDDTQELAMDTTMDPVMQLAESVEMEMPSDFMPGQMPPKRRGPGRPPKDGIMSKRERRLLQKQMQETSKKTVPLEPPSEKIKRPVGRPRKNPLPENGEKPEKRKYNKRKKEDGEEGSEAERRAKEKKDKKKAGRQTPPLVLNREDYTEEQLQKPSKNYSVLLDEALTNGPPEGLHLKQIYKRITEKYPWFYFSAETKGWESSVRHNLIGNEAFKKNEETGYWMRVPGVELDAGKKRKAPSPDRTLGSVPPHQMAQQPYFHGGNYMQQSSLKFANGLPGAAYANQNYQQQPQQPAIAQSVQPYAGSQPQAAGLPQYPVQAQATAQQPAGGVVGSSLLARQPTSTQQTTYSSPYARPPPAANPQVKAEAAAPNPQALPTASLQQPASYPPSTQPQRAVVASAGAVQLALHPDEEKSITMFKNNMIGVLSKSSDKARQIVETAVNRALGLPTQATLPGFENVENTLINAVHGMLKDMREKRQKAASASPAPPVPSAPSVTPTVAPPPPKQPTPAPAQSPAPSSSVETAIQKTVRGFRDNMVKALKTKTDQAEAIVDSAINRALGLPNPGPFKGWEQADRLMVENVTKMIADVRKNHTVPAQPAATTLAAGQPPQPQASQQSHPPQAPPPASPVATHQPSTPAPVAAPPQTTPSAAPAQPNISTGATPTSGNKPSGVPRPGISIARPSSIGIARPGAISVARPPVNRQNSTSTPTPAPGPSPTVTPQAAAPSPSQPPATTPVSTSTPAPAAVPVAASVNVSSSTSNHQEVAPIAKTVSPASLPSVSQPAITKTASPAPPPTTTPSAGAIEQIMGQKRSLDSVHGPGNEGVQQPEAKKLATSTPTT
ncbi:hypothetical protein BX600DRAFT_510041 [Xylariales sp. PMI_506]|nr:hypothetical protein BX600DRAFT_510041 [Xylariales sp. PMI_506]